MKKALNVCQKLKHQVFTLSKKETIKPLLIEIDMGTDQSISPIKHKDLSILTTEVNDIAIISKFNCDCIYIRYSTQAELTQAIKIIKRFIYKRHWHWLCHAIIISINKDCLLSISANQLHYIVDKIRACFNLKNQTKPPAYIYAVNITSNYTKNCQLAKTALQDLKAEHISSTTTIRDLKNIFFNLKFTDDNKTHITILLLADISTIILNIQQSKLKINKHFNYRGIIFNPDYDLSPDAITKKVYRLSMIDKAINIKLSNFWIVIIFLIICLLLILSYHYNDTLIYKLRSYKTENPSIKNLIKIDNLSKDSFLSIPYIKWASTRRKLYKKTQHTLQKLVKNDIRYSLLTTRIDTNDVFKKEINFSKKNNFFVLNKSNNQLVIPFIFTASGIHLYTIIHPENRTLLLLQKKQLIRYLIEQYIRQHIHALPSALFILYKLNLLNRQYNTQSMSFLSMVKLYKKLSSKLNQAHNTFDKSIIYSAEKFLIKKIEWTINKNWHRHMTHEKKLQVKILQEAGINTNINTWKVDTNKDKNTKIKLTARRLTSQDKSAELMLGSKILSFSHGPPTSVSLDINLLKNADCKVIFKKFNGQSSYIVINDHQNCIRGLILNHISNIQKSLVFISLSTGKEDFLLSIPASAYDRLLQIDRPNFLPLHIKLIGANNEI